MSQQWSNPSQVTSLWATWTATLVSATNQTNVCKWRRVGQMAEIAGKAVWSGAGGAGAITLTLPTVGVAGWTAANVIDTSALVGGTTTTNGGATMLPGSSCGWFDNGTGWKTDGFWAVYASTTTVVFASPGQLTDGAFFASGDSFNFFFAVPIVGWS